MVSLFGFFSSKKRAPTSRAASPSSADQTQSTNPTPNPSTPASASAFTPKPTTKPATGSNGHTGSTRPRPGRFLSLRRRSSKPYDPLPSKVRSNNDLPRRRSQQLPRSASENLAALYAPLPKLDLSFDKDLGLRDVVQPVVLGMEERAVVDQLELSLGEVKEGWEVFGRALKQLGMDKIVGIMLPRRMSTDAQTQSHLLGLYALALRPSLSSSLPSITAHYPESTDSSSVNDTERGVWRERLLNAVKDTQNPLDLAEILRWILRRLASSPISKEQYIKFVQAEHASSYPMAAYDTFLLPNLEATAKGYLHEVFEVLAGIATHAEENTMSAGRLALLLGFWILRETNKGEAGWRSLYKAWKEGGEKAEHLLYAWIRDQSTRQQIPTRLLELVDDYPFGESSASSEHLPLPPPSSFSRQTLHIVLGSTALIAGLHLTAEDLIRTALTSASEQDVAPLFASLTCASRGSSHMDDILADESLAFIREATVTTSAKSTPLSTPKLSDFATPVGTGHEGPMYRPFSTVSGGRTSPRNQLRVRSQSDNTSATTSAAQHIPGTSTDNTTAEVNETPVAPVNGDPSIWDAFRQSGFADSPNAVGDLELAFSPKVDAASSPKITSPTSPFTNNFMGTAPLKSPMKKKTTFLDERETKPRFSIMSEEIIEVDDVFMAFIEDGQLDLLTTSTWPPFALVRLAKPLESSDKSIEWLLITLEYRPPTPSNMSEPELLARAASPGAASITSRMSSSRGLKDLANSFKRSASFPLRPSPGNSMRRSFFGVSGRSLAKQAGSNEALEPLSEDAFLRGLKAPPSAQSLAPTEYTIGEMGEIIKIPSAATATQPKEAPSAGTTATADLGDKSSATTTADPSGETPTTDWAYVAEGNAHVVFAYRGSVPTYVGHVLRVRKDDSPGSKKADDRTDQQRQWRFDLLPKLLPAELLVRADEVILQKGWLRDLYSAADGMRPDSRKRKSLIEMIGGEGRGLLMENTTAVPVGADGNTMCLAVEIKPKWGFLPDAKWLQPPESIPIKTRHCRFCLHSHMRGTANMAAQESRYCPLDLYSGDEIRMKTALEGLWGMWTESGGKANNWRVFVDGIEMNPDQVSKIPTTVSSTSGSLVDGTAPFVLSVLQRSHALKHLVKLQSTLDATDISDLSTRFSASHPDAELFDPSLNPEPTLSELSEFLDVYLSHPDAGKSEEGWTLRQRLLAYSLSAIFKDCSVFVNCIFTRGSADSSWVGDQTRSKVRVIDLDLKPIKNLRKWYDLDHAIWTHAQSHPPNLSLCAPTAPSSSLVEDPDDNTEATTQEQEETPRRKLPPHLEIDSSSTRALFIPTPDRSALPSPFPTEAVPSTTVTGADRLSMIDALALSPTKPSRQTEVSADDQQVEEIMGQQRSSEDRELLDSPVAERRERSLAPSPSPRLLAHESLDEGGESEMVSPPKDVDLPALEEPALDGLAVPLREEPKVNQRVQEDGEQQDEVEETGVLAVIGAVAVGAVASVAAIAGLRDDASEQPVKHQQQKQEESTEHSEPDEATAHEMQVADELHPDEKVVEPTFDEDRAIEEYAAKLDAPLPSEAEAHTAAPSKQGVDSPSSAEVPGDTQHEGEVEQPASPVSAVPALEQPTESTEPEQVDSEVSAGVPVFDDILAQPQPEVDVTPNPELEEHQADPVNLPHKEVRLPQDATASDHTDPGDTASIAAASAVRVVQPEGAHEDLPLSGAIIAASPLVDDTASSSVLSPTDGQKEAESAHSSVGMDVAEQDMPDLRGLADSTFTSREDEIAEADPTEEEDIALPSAVDELEERDSPAAVEVPVPTSQVAEQITSPGAIDGQVEVDSSALSSATDDVVGAIPDQTEPLALPSQEEAEAEADDEAGQSPEKPIEGTDTEAHPDQEATSSLPVTASAQLPEPGDVQPESSGVHEQKVAPADEAPAVPHEQESVAETDEPASPIADYDNVSSSSQLVEALPSHQTDTADDIGVASTDPKPRVEVEGRGIDNSPVLAAAPPQTGTETEVALPQSPLQIPSPSVETTATDKADASPQEQALSTVTPIPIAPNPEEETIEDQPHPSTKEDQPEHSEGSGTAGEENTSASEGEGSPAQAEDQQAGGEAVSIEDQLDATPISAIVDDQLTIPAQAERSDEIPAPDVSSATADLAQAPASIVGKNEQNEEQQQENDRAEDIESIGGMGDAAPREAAPASLHPWPLELGAPIAIPTPEADEEAPLSSPIIEDQPSSTSTFTESAVQPSATQGQSTSSSPVEGGGVEPAEAAELAEPVEQTNEVEAGVEDEPLGSADEPPPIDVSDVSLAHHDDAFGVEDEIGHDNEREREHGDPIPVSVNANVGTATQLGPPDISMTSSSSESKDDAVTATSIPISPNLVDGPSTPSIDSADSVSQTPVLVDEEKPLQFSGKISDEDQEDQIATGHPIGQDAEAEAEVEAEAPVIVPVQAGTADLADSVDSATGLMAAAKVNVEQSSSHIGGVEAEAI